MRPELELYGYVIFRPHPELSAPPIVVMDIGWDSPEDTLAHVNMHAMCMGEDEVFKPDVRDWYSNLNDGSMVIGQFDVLMRGLMCLISSFECVQWGADVFQTHTKVPLQLPHLN